MQVDGHTATVILDLNGTIFEKGYIDSAAVTRQRFVNAVIDDFLGKMIGTGGIGVHARPPPDGFEATQDLNI
jgi:hypothetical protein